MTVTDIEHFVAGQLACWPLAAANHAALNDCLVKMVGNTTVMFNPARVKSSTAQTDRKSVAARPCFLCKSNRPAEQHFLNWCGYEILVNPFPIFPGHLTVAAVNHIPQDISGRLADMIGLARMLEDYTVFFNGARCGASAPDHFHFQAAKFKVNIDEACCRLIDCTDTDKALEIATAYLERLGDPCGEMVNILCFKDSNGSLNMAIVPRGCHRPSFYGTGPGEMLVSPAAVEMAGYLILARREDYLSITPEIIERMMDEVVVR